MERQEGDIATEMDPERSAGEALGRADHEGALSILMGAYGTAVYRFCLQIVGDPDLAEDAHQMTFVQAFRDMGRFAGRSTLKTWLFGIARHRSLDAKKERRRRERRFPTGVEVADSPDPTATAEGGVIGRSLREALRHCLDQLTPRVRETVALRFQHEFSYPEIEKINGERATTLQARVARSLPVLRRCLLNRGVTV